MSNCVNSRLVCVSNVYLSVEIKKFLLWQRLGKRKKYMCVYTYIYTFSRNSCKSDMENFLVCKQIKDGDLKYKDM